MICLSSSLNCIAADKFHTDAYRQSPWLKIVYRSSMDPRDYILFGNVVGYAEKRKFPVCKPKFVPGFELDSEIRLKSHK